MTALNRSAESVFAHSRKQGSEAQCFEKCLKRLTAAERKLILQLLADQNARNLDLQATRGVIVSRVKKIRARLRKCITNCLKEIEENTLPV